MGTEYGEPVSVPSDRDAGWCSRQFRVKRLVAGSFELVVFDVATERCGGRELCDATRWHPKHLALSPPHLRANANAVVLLFAPKVCECIVMLHIRPVGILPCAMVPITSTLEMPTELRLRHDW